MKMLFAQFSDGISLAFFLGLDRRHSGLCRRFGFHMKVINERQTHVTCERREKQANRLAEQVNSTKWFSRSRTNRRWPHDLCSPVDLHHKSCVFYPKTGSAGRPRTVTFALIRRNTSGKHFAAAFQESQPFLFNFFFFLNHFKSRAKNCLWFDCRRILTSDSISVAFVAHNHRILPVRLGFWSNTIEHLDEPNSRWIRKFASSPCWFGLSRFFFKFAFADDSHKEFGVKKSQPQWNHYEIKMTVRSRNPKQASRSKRRNVRFLRGVNRPNRLLNAVTLHRRHDDVAVQSKV